MWTPVGLTPKVRVFSLVPSAIRGDSVPAAIVFTRDGDTAAPLQIFYTLSGSGNPSGVAPLPTGSVIIPAGMREFKLSLAALASTLPQGEKSLVFQLSARASYSLDENDSVNIALRDKPFDSWRFNRFNSAELADPSISGPFADPDSTGPVNLLRFFSGTESGPRTSLLTQGGALYFQIDRQRAAADLGYSIEEADDLLHWNPCPQLPLHAPIQDHGEVQQIQIPVRSPGTTIEGKKFFRLKVVP
jgi:hypothetical protein